VRVAGMAALTQHGHPHREKVRVVGAVRRVTRQTVVANRPVFPQKRSALLVVTRDTERVDSRVTEQFVTRGTVNVMTFAAGHSRAALIVRENVRGALQLSSPHRSVTCIAGFCFGGFAKECARPRAGGGWGRLSCMDLMAADTTQTRPGMVIVLPAAGRHQRAMTPKAGRISLRLLGSRWIEDVVTRRSREVRGGSSMAGGA
jgi:hypothetical protein